VCGIRERERDKERVLEPQLTIEEEVAEGAFV